jgi:hypothetical protein
MPESPSRPALSRTASGVAAAPLKTYGGTRSYLAEVAVTLPETGRSEDIKRTQEVLAGHEVAKADFDDDAVLQKLGARPVPKMRESYTELKRKYAMDIDSNEGGDAAGEGDSQVGPPGSDVLGLLRLILRLLSIGNVQAASNGL